MIHGFVTGESPPPQIQPPASPPEGAPMESVRVERQLDLSLNPPDRISLDAILEDRPASGVFVSTAWLSGFFDDPPDGFTPSLLIFREGARLCGVVPIACCETATHMRVSLLGGGLGSDRIDLVAAHGYDTRCADAFLAWLAEAYGPSGFVLELRDVPSDSSIWGAVRRATAEGRLAGALTPLEIHALPYLDFTTAIGDAASRRPLEATAMPSFEKHRRWLERRGRIRIEMPGTPDEALAGFDALVQFLQRRWSGQGGSVLDDPRRRSFHRRVIPRLLSAGQLRMIRVSADGRDVAIYYGLASGPWWGYYLAGYDREWAGRIHLGRIILATAIDHARRSGATEFDFLKGVERVKYLWPVRERTTMDADVFADRPGPQVVRAGRAGRETAAALAKAARGLLSRGGR